MSAQNFEMEDVIDLARFDESFAKASVRADNGPDPLYDVPDGYYQASIDDAHLTRTQRTGNPMIVWRLRITGPHSPGKTLTKTRVITDKTLGFVKEDLLRCGLRIEKLSDLQPRLGEMCDREVEVFKKTRDGWSEVYFCRPSRPIEGSEPGTGAGSGAGSPPGAKLFDDDLPF